MKRTQIYLTDREWTNLSALSRNRGVTLASLIRDAIDSTYAGTAPQAFTTALDRVMGLWSGRTDLPNSRTYVRRLRDRDRRPGLL